MIGITPNGAISYISDSYGGKASDVFIVNNTGFSIFLQPGDQVMANTGFKMQDILNFHQCSLWIPPSKHTHFQMAKANVAKTSKNEYNQKNIIKYNNQKNERLQNIK